MKKRLMSLLLATMMLLSILPVGVSALPVTGNTGVPTEPELRMHVRQWRDGVESEYVTTEFSYPLLDWWDARFFMYYPDGSTKQVDPYAMGRTTEIDLIGVDADGWAEHRTAHVGPGLIDYTENGVTYHIEVDVHYPDLGMYDAMPFDESSIVNHLTVSEAGDTYYIALSEEKLDEGMRMAAVNTSFDSYIDDPSLTEVANVVVSNDCTYATVTFHTVVGGNYHFEARMIDTLGMDQGRWGRSVRVESDAPGLYFCYADRDDSTESWFINYDQIDDQWYTVPGHNKVGSFFFGKRSDIAAGKVDPIPLKDLVFHGDLDADDLEDDYTPTENLLIVDATGFGGKYIRYIKDGVHYDMPVCIELPDIGIYSTADPSQTGYVYRQKPFTITETARTLYLLPDDTTRTRIVDIPWMDGRVENLFDISRSTDGSMIKLTVKDGVIVPNGNFDVEVEFERLHGNGQWERDIRNVTLSLENGQPALMFRHLEWDDEEQEWFEPKRNPLETVVDFDLGEEFAVQFYYGTEDDYEAVDLDELTFPAGVMSGFMREGAQWVKGIGFWEEGYITYINEDGETVQMYAVSEQPSMAFYSSTTPSKATWLGEEVTFDTKVPVYLITRENEAIDEITQITEWRYSGGKDMLDWFDIQLAANGSYAAITMQEGPDGELPIGSHYDIQLRTTRGGRWGRSFTLIRGDLPQLATPTNLVWHKEYHQWTNSAGQVQLNTETRMGDMSFEVHGLCQNRFDVELYSAEDGYTTPIGEYGWGFGDKKDRTHFSVCDFIYADLPSGTYKFRVRTRGDGTAYRSSEWSALSPAFTYTQPAQRLTAPAADDLAWERIDGRFAATWPLSAGTQTGAECFEIQWYYRDENGKICESGSSFDMYVSDNFRNGKYFEHIQDWLLEEHGNTEYFFTIRVIPGDITKYRPSKHSGRSAAFTMDNITDAVNDKLDNLLTGSATVPTVQDVQDALFGDTGDLRMAMAADQSIAGGTSGGTLDRIRLLEQAAADNVVQQVKAKTNAPQQLKDITNGITMIGATLNLADKNPSSGTTPTVTLEIDEPQQGIVINEQQHNAVQFSMKLNGAVDKDDQNQAGQQLIVPVAIDMPVPSGISHEFLVVLHRLWDGSVEEMRPYIYWHETDLCWHARFVVDSFSDFALVEDRSLEDGEEDEDESEEIELRKIVLRDPETGDKLNAIPEGPADVTVKVMGLEEDTNCVIILTAYAENGQMVDLKVLKERSFTDDGMAWYDTSIDNADGRIASLKAMAVPKMISATPLCAAVEFAPDAPIVTPPDDLLEGYILITDSDILNGTARVYGLPMDGSGFTLYDLYSSNENGDRRYLSPDGIWVDIEEDTWGIVPHYSFYAYAMSDEGMIVLKSLGMTEANEWSATGDFSVIEATGGRNLAFSGAVGYDLVMDEGTKLTQVYTNGTEITVGYNNIMIDARGANVMVITEDTEDDTVKLVKEIYVAYMTEMPEGAPDIETYYGYYNGEPLEQMNGLWYIPLYVEGERYVLPVDADISLAQQPAKGIYFIEVTEDDALEVIITDMYLATDGEKAVEVFAVYDDHFIYIDERNAEVYVWFDEQLEIYDMTNDGEWTSVLEVGDKVLYTTAEDYPATGMIWILGHGAEEVAPSMEVFANGSRAEIAVLGELSATDYVMVHAMINGEYEEVGPATWEVLGDGVTTFSFENPYDFDTTFLFQLWVDGEVAAWKTADLTAKKEIKTGLLPTNIHLEYDPHSGLRMVMDKPADPSLVDGSIAYAYDINNGENTFSRNLSPKLGSTAFLTNYDVLQEGDNLVTITLTANPTAEAAAQGYGLESTNFTASVYYAEETGTYDTDAVDVSIEDIEDANGKAMKELHVSGLKPNQSYMITAWTDDGISNKRELTTDASGAATDKWYSDYDFTYCTIAEWWVTNVFDNSANIICRKYAGTFHLGSIEEEEPLPPTMKITAADARADIAVYAEDMSMVDRIEVHALLNGEYEYVANAAWEVIGDGVIYFSFENPYTFGCAFLFQLWSGDAVAEWQTLVLPAAALRLLPDDMHLTSENSDVLKISWTPVSDADMLVSKVRTSYDVNNGSYTTSSNSSFSLLFSSGTSLLPSFKSLQVGENTVAVTFTAEPSAYAAGQGYAAEQYTFTANVHVTETTADYDTSKITVDKDEMFVSGLKPNQTYQAKLYTAANDLYTVEFTTDASGCGDIDRWYGVSFTHMTLAEWEVCNVSANSADIIVRKYAGTVYFTFAEDPTGVYTIEVVPAGDTATLTITGDMTAATVMAIGCENGEPDTLLAGITHQLSVGNLHTYTFDNNHELAQYPYPIQFFVVATDGSNTILARSAQVTLTYTEA